DSCSLLSLEHSWAHLVRPVSLLASPPAARTLQGPQDVAQRPRCPPPTQHKAPSVASGATSAHPPLSGSARPASPKHGETPAALCCIGAHTGQRLHWAPAPGARPVG